MYKTLFSTAFFTVAVAPVNDHENDNDSASSYETATEDL